MTEIGRILVTGATGYIGGRLVPRLLDVGHGRGLGRAARSALRRRDPRRDRPPHRARLVLQPRAQNLDLPAGSLEGSGAELTVRFTAERNTATALAASPTMTSCAGTTPMSGW